MGALRRRRHGGHKNKASGGHLGSCRPGFGTYGRGNFPGHDVFGVLPKTLRIECRWMRIGLNGRKRPYVYRGNAKQDQKNTNERVGTYFLVHIKGKKTTKSARMAAASKEDKWGGVSGWLGVQG